MVIKNVIQNNIIMDIFNNVLKHKSVAGDSEKYADNFTPLEKLQEYFRIKSVEYENLGKEDAIINDSLESRAERLKQIKSEAERVCYEVILEYGKKINKRQNDIKNYENLGYMTSKGNAEVDIANCQMEKEYVNNQYLKSLTDPDTDIYAAYKRGFENGIVAKNK